MRLERANTVCPLQRKRHSIEAVRQAVFSRGIDIKMYRRTGRRGERLRLKVNGCRKAFDAGCEIEETVNLRCRQHHRQQPIGEAIAEKDVSETRCHHGTDAEIA